MNIIERAEKAWNEKADGFNQWPELDIEEKLEAIAEEIKKLGPEIRAQKSDHELASFEGFEQFIDTLRGEPDNETDFN